MDISASSQFHPADLGTSGRDAATAPEFGHDHLKGEDSFRRVVEWAPSAMVMIDADGPHCPGQCRDRAGVRLPARELVGQPVEMLVPERFSGHHGDFRDGFFANPTPRPMGSGRDLFARHADGSEFPVEIGLNPIETEGGTHGAGLDRGHHRAQARAAALENALEEKTVLLNEVHHRVKNNLQMISSLLNLQAANADDPRLREVLNESQNRVQADGLTHQLLYEHKDFSRIDLGEYLGRLAQLSAERLSSDARGRVALQAGAAGGKASTSSWSGPFPADWSSMNW